MSDTVGQFAQTVIENITHFASIIQILSIAGGMGLFVSSLFELKRYGEMRTIMSHQMTIAKPLSMMLAGIMLLVLPLMISTFMLGFWGSANPMAYQATSKEGWAPLIPVVIDFVRVVGIAAFARGIFLISRAGSGQSAPGSMSKAFLHMFGGILCINVVATMHLMHMLLPI